MEFQLAQKLRQLSETIYLYWKNYAPDSLVKFKCLKFCVYSEILIYSNLVIYANKNYILISFPANFMQTANKLSSLSFTRKTVI